MKTVNYNTYGFRHHFSLFFTPNYLSIYLWSNVSAMIVIVSQFFSLLSLSFSLSIYWPYIFYLFTIFGTIKIVYYSVVCIKYFWHIDLFCFTTSVCLKIIIIIGLLDEKKVLSLSNGHCFVFFLVIIMVRLGYSPIRIPIFFLHCFFLILIFNTHTHTNIIIIEFTLKCF